MTKKKKKGNGWPHKAGKKAAVKASKKKVVKKKANK